MEKIFKIHPAYDKRHPDPKKDYGIHGCEMLFVLKGEKGAVQFVLYTNWHLPHVQEEMDQKTLNSAAIGEFDQTRIRVFYHPLPADLGYHSSVPMYDGQKATGATYVDMEAMTRNMEKLKDAQRLGIEPEEMEESSLPTGVTDPCDYLDGKPCYYDGSGLNAIPVFERLLKEGSDGVWDELEKYYKSTFEKEET